MSKFNLNFKEFQNTELCKLFDVISKNGKLLREVTLNDFIFENNIEIYPGKGCYFFILNNQIEKKPQLNGYGKSLILQGSFLLIFDGLMFALNRRNRKIFLSPNFGSTQLNIGVSVRY